MRAKIFVIFLMVIKSTRIEDKEKYLMDKIRNLEFSIQEILNENKQVAEPGVFSNYDDLDPEKIIKEGVGKSGHIEQTLAGEIVDDIEDQAVITENNLLGVKEKNHLTDFEDLIQENIKKPEILENSDEINEILIDDFCTNKIALKENEVLPFLGPTSKLLNPLHEIPSSPLDQARNVNKYSNLDTSKEILKPIAEEIVGNTPLVSRDFGNNLNPFLGPSTLLDPLHKISSSPLRRARGIAKYIDPITPRELGRPLVEETGKNKYSPANSRHTREIIKERILPTNPLISDRLTGFPLKNGLLGDPLKGPISQRLGLPIARGDLLFPLKRSDMVESIAKNAIANENLNDNLNDAMSDVERQKE